MPSKIAIPQDKVRDFCNRNHIQKFALFGSVLRDDFGSESDIDVLVEFEPGAGVGFFILILLSIFLLVSIPKLSP
jgi:Predicted nucleotidyltransferases